MAKVGLWPPQSRAGIGANLPVTPNSESSLVNEGKGGFSYLGGMFIQVPQELRTKKKSPGG